MAFKCILCNPPKQFTHPVSYNLHKEKMHSSKDFKPQASSVCNMNSSQNLQPVSPNSILHGNQRSGIIGGNGGKFPVRCDCCDADFTGPASAQAHFEGKRHKKKVQQNYQNGLQSINVPSTLLTSMSQHELSQCPPPDVIVFEVDEEVNFL